jgi:hypothetical protein
LAQYVLYETNYELIADMLANDLILGWVSGKYEIGPRALGNRSILAAPFQESTRVRLNEIKQREQFRPIAPIMEDAQPRGPLEQVRVELSINGEANVLASKPLVLRQQEQCIRFQVRTDTGWADRNFCPADLAE